MHSTAPTFTLAVGQQAENDDYMCQAWRESET